MSGNLVTPTVTGPRVGVSSQGEESIKLFISTALLLPITLALLAYVVKNGRKWILIIARSRHDRESYELLSKFIGSFVAVHVVDLGIHFTTTLLRRKGGDYIYVNIPSKLKQFFLPAWQEDKPLTVLVTIDPRLLRNNAQG
jgi:hypothetical protein